VCNEGINIFLGGGTMENFWESFYDAIREMIFSDKIYVFREIVKEPKTIREIAEAVGMPYVTVRKYMRWAYERGLATVVGTKKERGAISEKWLLTFVPEVIEVKENNLVVKIKLKIKIRKEFCEQICPFKEECPTFERVKKGVDVIPYRELEIERKLAKGVEHKICTPIVAVTSHQEY